MIYFCSARAKYYYIKAMCFSYHRNILYKKIEIPAYVGMKKK